MITQEELDSLQPGDVIQLTENRKGFVRQVGLTNFMTDKKCVYAFVTGLNYKNSTFTRDKIISIIKKKQQQ